MGVGESRREHERLPISGDRLVQLAFVFQRHTEVVVRAGKAGRERDGLSKGGDGFIQVAFLHEGVAEVVMGFGIVGPDRERPAASFDGLFESAFVFQRNAKIAVSLGMVRPVRDGLPPSLDGFVQLAFVLQRIAETVMRLGIARTDRERPADEIHRHIVPPHLAGDDAQKMQRPRVLRFRRENLPVERLRLTQPPGLVVLERDLNGLLGIHCRKVRSVAGVGKYLELLAHLDDDGIPFHGALLAEKPHRRIPRAVLTPEHPPPVRRKRKQHPHGLAERAG